MERPQMQVQITPEPSRPLVCRKKLHYLMITEEAGGPFQIGDKSIWWNIDPGHLLHVVQSEK